jgi:homocitrate synthase NifV
MARSRPHIIDTTLRDGEQAPGVVFHLDDKLRIAHLLDEIGIPEVEIGTPIIGPQEVADLRVLTHAGFHFQSLVWCRATKADIDAAARTGAHGVNISFPVSDVHLSAMNRSHTWVLEVLHEIVDYASPHFEYLVIGAQDASRANTPFLLEFLKNVLALNVRRVRIADTVGILHPMSTQSLFMMLRNHFPSMSLEFHGHNDLGMAVANTISALLSGADSASVTVNGLGERAGNAALEEVVMALELACNVKTQLDTSLFGNLSDIVTLASDVANSVQKPVVGRNVFSHESGIHAHLMMKNRNTYQIIDGQNVGRGSSEFVFGKHTGSAAVEQFCLNHHIALSRDSYVPLTNALKNRAVRLKRALTSEEVLGEIEALTDTLPFSPAVTFQR